MRPACNIHSNPDGGVFADTGSQVVLRSTTIQNNIMDVTNDSSAESVGQAEPLPWLTLTPNGRVARHRSESL